jgi:4-hydroxy-2-oxoheptanedioate aldolase
MLKKKLSKKKCLGVFSKTLDSAFIEATGYSGMDFVIIDNEHGAASSETIHNHVRAAKVANISSIIRTKDYSTHSIGAALDSGADGIQIPNIISASQALLSVANARFYPKGERGVCRFVKAANYGTTDKKEYFSKANDKLLILQVEGVEGINNLDDILKVKGIDVLFIGPYDLSQSLGVPGDITSNLVKDRIVEITKKAKAQGIFVGCFSDSIENMNWLKSLGVDYIAYSVDVNIYIEACKDIFSRFNK